MGSNTQVFIKRYGNNVCLSTSESALYLDDMHSMQQVFVTRCVVPSFMWESNVVGAKPALPKRYAPLDDTHLRAYVRGACVLAAAHKAAFG